MTRLLSAICLTALALTASACERREERDPRPVLRRALRGVLVYPLSSKIDFAVGEEVGQATLATPDSVVRVATWFREALRLNGWTLQSDLTARDGIVTIYAERGRQPLWITLRPNSGAPGTTYTVIGAIVEDSATAGRDSTKGR
jgi:hypothetical protein